MFSSSFGHLWKKPQTTQTRAYSPQRPVAFAFGELLPQPLCGRLFQIWDDIIGYFNSSSAAPKRLREQLASGTRERATSCAAVRLRLCGLRFFQLGQRWENIIRKMWAVKIYFFRTKIIFSDIRIANQLFTQKIGKILRFPI